MDKKKVVVDGVKTYDEKVSDYKQHFDDLGMSDPGTVAREQAMETALPRGDVTEERASELVDRDRVREEHNGSLDQQNPGTTGRFGEIPAARKAMNEKLSDQMTDRKEHDEEQQKMTETGEIANMTRGASEEAETGIADPKKAKAAVNEAKKK